MLKNYFGEPIRSWGVAIFICCLGLSALQPVNAMSRLFDGDARVWASGMQLCIGVADTYKVGGLFSSTKHVEDNQVRLHAVSVNRNTTEVWLQGLPLGSDESGLRLEPSRCIEYGKLPEDFVAKTPAQPLQPGLHELYLLASDQKNRRA